MYYVEFSSTGLTPPPNTFLCLFHDRNKFPSAFVVVFFLFVFGSASELGFNSWLVIYCRLFPFNFPFFFFDIDNSINHVKMYIFKYIDIPHLINKHT